MIEKYLFNHATVSGFWPFYVNASEALLKDSIGELSVAISLL